MPKKKTCAAQDKAWDAAMAIAGSSGLASTVVHQAEEAVQRELIINLIGEDRYWLLVETHIRS